MGSLRRIFMLLLLAETMCAYAAEVWPGDQVRFSSEALVTLLVPAAFLVRTATLMLWPLLIALAAAFHTSVAAAGQLAAAINLSWALTALVAGPVSDTYGRRRVALTGLLVMTVGILGSVLAWNYGTLLVCRLLTSVGAAMIPPNGMAAIADHFPPAHRGGRAESRVHVDGIALSPNDEFLYFHALTGRTLYRVATTDLADRALTPAQLGGKVQQVADTGPANGMECAPDGTLYLTSLEDHAVKQWSPSEEVKIVVQDHRLQWPDSLAVAPDGTIYVTTSRIHLGKGPYSVFRFKP